ncbi:hypothetical protein A3K86_20980 [Photobacterium jeanii]|uniref:Diguanylate cyclase n=1 Tax=Photobacterium jeanii TaxID=858640 RepID=A0A178K2B2_9GAMM|nr:diguanylate cyclase [Photobacterium jeanii]OAN11421.1 hypothetical protein A3K86_20980 [Photobacterium jeanii]PST90941.1 PAS domain S-box protein [Photobacterium jeanii]
MRNYLKSMSIRQKMTIPVTTILIVIFFAFSIFSVFSVLKTEQDNLLARSFILGKGVAINLKAALLFDDAMSSEEILSAFRADHLVYHVDVVKEDGSVFATYHAEGIAKSGHIQKDIHLDLRESFAKLNKNAFDHYFTSDYLYISIPVVVAQSNVASMQGAISLQELNKAKTDLLRFCMLLLIPMALLCILLLRQLRIWVVRPVENLSNAMQNLASTQRLNQRPKVHANDEIGSLVKCFNDMLDHMEERDAQISATLDQVASEKAFVDDVLSTVQHALLVLNDKGQIVLANSACREVFQCVDGDFRGLTLRDIMNDKFWDVYGTELEPVLTINNEGFDKLIKANDPQELPHYYNVKARPLVERNQLLVAIEDVTQKYLSEEQQRLAARIFDQSSEGILVTDSEGMIQMVNSALTNMMGYVPEHLMGHFIDEFLSMENFAEILQTLQLHGGRWRGELCEKRSDGVLIPLEVRANIIGGHDGERMQIVMSISDLSHIKELEQLEYLAHHDALTGLANRKRLFDVLEDKIQTADIQSDDKFAVLYIDLDGFKPVNDTYGHHVGDKVLKVVAERMLASVRDGDFVARLAGDEFVIIVNNIRGYREALYAANRISDAISRCMHIEKHQLKVGASIGFSVIQHSKLTSIEEVLQAADAAMYKAKQNRNSSVVCADVEELRK